MKLLDPKKHKKGVSDQEQQAAEKIRTLDRLAFEKRKKYDAFLVKIAEKKATIERAFADFVTQSDIKRNNINNEIGTLEGKREALLEPITTELEELEIERQQLNGLKAEIEIEQQNVELAIVTLDRKRERDNKTSEELTERKKNLDELYTEYKVLTDNILKRDQELADRTTKFNRFCKEKGEEIQKQISSIEVRELTIQSDKQFLKDQQIKLNKDKQHLASQRQALQTAFDEARKKGINICL